MKSICYSLSIAFKFGAVLVATASMWSAQASEHTISWMQLNGTTSLDDGDKISVVMLPSGPSADKIAIKLQSNVTWWKGIQAGGIVLCQTQDGQNFSSSQFSVSDLNSNGLQLWKAKAWGVHTNEYNIGDAATYMAGGNTYVFTWQND